MNRINQRILIPIGIGVVIVIIWFVALWGPQGSSLSKAKKRKDDAVAQVANLRNQIVRLREAQRDQPAKQARLETMRLAIPDDPNLAQFILDANAAASKAGIDFLSITPTPPGTGQSTTATTAAGGAAAGGGPPPTAIRVGMTISGGYFQVIDFVNLLNRLPRIVVIDSLNLSSTPDGAVISVTLQERIFTSSQQPVAGSTSGAGAGSTTTTGPGGTATTTTTTANG